MNSSPTNFSNSMEKRQSDPVMLDAVAMEPGVTGANTNNGETAPLRRKTAAQHTGVSDVLIAGAAVVIPMVLLSALLLGLISQMRVRHNPPVDESLTLEHTRGRPGEIYIDMNYSRLNTIASWSSTVAPILTGFCMALFAFPAARSLLLSAGQDGGKQGHMTPYQLALSIQLISATGLGTVGKWIHYSIGMKRKRQIQPPVMVVIGTVGTMAVILSLLVLLADTWLHVTTRPAEFIQVFGVDAAASNVSYRLRPGCLRNNNSFVADYYGISNGSCTMSCANHGCYSLQPDTSLQVMANMSLRDAVHTYTSNGDDHAYLTPLLGEDLQSLDYKAKTFSVLTQCRAASQECGLQQIAACCNDFKCPYAFEGTLGDEGFLMAYYTDSSAEKNRSDPESMYQGTIYGVENPYYFSIAASNMGGYRGRDAGKSSLGGDPEVIGQGHGALSFILFCNTTVFDIEYTVLNGTIRSWKSTESNASVANIIQSMEQYTLYARSQLGQAILMASYSLDFEMMARRISTAYSNAALAIASSAFEREPALSAQRRESRIITVVEIAPLTALVFSNLILALFGLVLAILAMSATMRQDGVADGQRRLTIAGIVADRFEVNPDQVPSVDKVEDFFKETSGSVTSKIRLERTSAGGVVYTSSE